MVISFASKDDTTSIRYIWNECFGDPESYMDAFFSFTYSPEQTLVAKFDGMCVGALQLFPHTFLIDGREYKSMYIGGVSVLPAYRKQGIAKRLMGAAESYMREENVEISFLVPFSFAFYEKLGYKCVSYLSEFSGKIGELKYFVLPFERVAYSAALLSDAYKNYARNFTVYLERDTARFTKEILPLCEKHSVFLLPENAGYLIYEIKGRTFRVAEIAYKDESSLRKLLGFIYEQKEVCDTFFIRASANGFLRQILCENTIMEKRFPHAMAKTFSDLKICDSMRNYINMLGWF